MLANDADAGSARQVVEFGPFRLDTGSGELTRLNVRVKVVGQPLQVLEALLHRPGEVVTQEELAQCLWPDGTFVDFDHGLRAAVLRLRAALGDSANEPQFVETLPRRGYRYVGPPPLWTLAQSSRRHWRVPRSAAVFLVLVVLAIAAVWLQDRMLTPNVRPVVAILPFRDLTGDLSDAATEALTEAVIHNLARLDPGSLGVVAHAESRKFRDVTDLTYALGATFIVESYVRKSGDALETSVRLIRFEDRTQVWASSFPLPNTLLAADTAGAARTIAEALAIEIGRPEGRTPVPDESGASGGDQGRGVGGTEAAANTSR